MGSCGYGLLDKSKWPYWSVGALSTDNIYYGEGPVRGCGVRLLSPSTDQVNPPAPLGLA